MLRAGIEPGASHTIHYQVRVFRFEDIFKFTSEKIAKTHYENHPFAPIKFCQGMKLMNPTTALEVPFTNNVLMMIIKMLKSEHDLS